MNFQTSRFGLFFESRKKGSTALGFDFRGIAEIKRAKRGTSDFGIYWSLPKGKVCLNFFNWGEGCVGMLESEFDSIIAVGEPYIVSKTKSQKSLDVVLNGLPVVNADEASEFDSQIENIRAALERVAELTDWIELHADKIAK